MKSRKSKGRKYKKAKVKTMMYKTLHRNLKMEQH